MNALIPALNEQETRIFTFPVFDFNGIAPGNLTASADNALKLMSNGDWLVWGHSATMCEASAGGLANGALIYANIFDPTLSQYWFTGGSAGANVGLPLQLVAGKTGNPRWYSVPKLLKAGTQLILYASHADSGTPSGRSPLYFSLICTLNNVQVA